MKERKYNYDFVNTWRDSKIDEYGRYIWLQFDYLTENKQPYHICAELNETRQGNIVWNVTNDTLNVSLPVTNINFVDNPPVIFKEESTSEWDYQNWFKTLSELSDAGLRSNDLKKVPESYDEYHRLAALSAVSCLDIDIIEKVGGAFVGVEATHLFKSMFNEGEAKRLFSFILEKRLFLRGAHQLETQLNCMKKLGGNLYLLTYNTKNDALEENGNATILLIDDDVIDLIRRRNAKEILNRLEFGKFTEIYKKIKNQ